MKTSLFKHHYDTVKISVLLEYRISFLCFETSNLMVIIYMEISGSGCHLTDFINHRTKYCLHTGSYQSFNYIKRSIHDSKFILFTENYLLGSFFLKEKRPKLNLLKVNEQFVRSKVITNNSLCSGELKNTILLLSTNLVNLPKLKQNKQNT